MRVNPVQVVHHEGGHDPNGSREGGDVVDGALGGALSVEGSTNLVPEILVLLTLLLHVTAQPGDCAAKDSDLLTDSDLAWLVHQKHDQERPRNLLGRCGRHGNLCRAGPQPHRSACRNERGTTHNQLGNRKHHSKANTSAMSREISFKASTAEVMLDKI